MGRRDLAHYDGGADVEMQLIKKFYWKFPEVKYMPISGPLKTLRGGSMRFTHPASVFVHKQKHLMKQGYTEYKAFEMVEAELQGIIQKHKDETRILRGVALDQNVYTYLERFQMVAEMESLVKMQRLERDMPKFLRAQKSYIKEFDDEMAKTDKQAAAALGLTTEEFMKQKGIEHENTDGESYKRETMEDLLQRQYDYEGMNTHIEFQPVLYEIIKDPQELADRESLTQTHDKFIDRSDNMMKLHHQRSHIHDGLKHLSDR